MKRPRSSVTTILMKLVGRSLVSAITHTPASGPFSPCTVPVIYPEGAPACWARVGRTANVPIKPSTPAPTTAIRAVLLEIFMELLLINRCSSLPYQYHGMLQYKKAPRATQQVDARPPYGNPRSLHSVNSKIILFPAFTRFRATGRGKVPLRIGFRN